MDAANRRFVDGRRNRAPHRGRAGVRCGRHIARGAFLLWAMLLLSPAGARAADRPAEILSWRHQILEPERYAELGKQWEAYADKHPQDARAWVQWGNALRYSGEREKALSKYARAFAVDSTDAAAISAYCLGPAVELPEAWKLAHQRMRGAVAREPDYPNTYYGLWSTSLRSGDEALAAECLRRVVRLGDMPQPLLDFGYNMVAGAPIGAIILTNGDNDTYPPLAYQALTGQRPDVAIVNLSLLNTPWYIRYWRDKGLAIGLDDAAIDALEPVSMARLVCDQVQERLYENLQKAGWPRPLFYCVTVVEDRKVLPGQRVLEGLLERVGPGVAPGKCCGEPDWKRMRELVDTVYRLDSAVDPFVDWERESAVARGMRNYAAILTRLGDSLLTGGARDDAGRYFYQAVRILAFHGGFKDADEALASWEKGDPKARLLPSARDLVKRR